MKRVLALIVAILVTWLGMFAPPLAAEPVASAPELIHAYAYDSHHDTAVSAYTIAERGPPATYDAHTDYDVVHRWSRGAVARFDAPGAVATTTYTISAEFAQAAGTTRGQVEFQVGPSAVIEWEGIAANSAGEGDHIVLGIEKFGLEDTAAKVGGRTLLNDPNFMSSLKAAIANPSTKFTVSLDGMSGSSTYAQVMNSVQRGAGAGTRGWATDWEMLQLHRAGRLPDVTFVRGGNVVRNPWGP